MLSGVTMLVSVVITVKNEEKHIKNLLSSLVTQEPPFEVIVVDAYSTDNTAEIVKQYEKQYTNIKLFQGKGSRGKGRNLGAEKAKGEILAFIDGDCIAKEGWVQAIRENYSKKTILAGKTVSRGTKLFNNLDRVELYINGYDVTYPSTNLAYPIEEFKAINGFDTSFITAEDIDLNLRAVKNGCKIQFIEKMEVEHYSRDTWKKFVKQAFWNGYGRKQLTKKHGNLWKNYKPSNMVKNISNPIAFIRAIFALSGYIVCKINPQLKEK